MSLCGSTTYIIKLRALIFGSVMYLIWGDLQERDCVSVHNILLVINFLKILHFPIYIFQEMT